MKSDPSSEHLQVAARAVERLIGVYPSISAIDPQIYAAGMVQLFSHYPEHLIAEAIDPVNGLPSLHDYPPTLKQAKAFLEPRRAHEDHMREMKERFERKRLPEPPRDPEQDKKIEQGFRQLSAYLAAGHGPSS